MRLARIIEQVYHKPWLITPTMHASIRRIIETKMAREPSDLERAWGDDLAVQRPVMVMDRKTGVATIYIQGVIGQGLSNVERACGASDSRDIRGELLEARESASAIFLAVDSPGGMVTGTAETARLIAEIAGEMPVVAYTDSQACSAAYWMASHADEFYASESADVGSIGVYIPWVDDSAALERMGVKLEAIANEGAPFKGLGFDPHLNDDQRAHLQEMVNQMASDFQSAVQTARKEAILPEMFRGHYVYGAEAESMGLIDGIRSRDGAMQRLLEML